MVDVGAWVKSYVGGKFRGFGSQERLPRGGVVFKGRRVLQENWGSRTPWSRPRNTDHRVGVGQPEGGEQCVKFHQPPKQLVGVCFESHHRSGLSDIKYK